MFKLLALSSVATICALSAGRQARKENKRLRKQLVAKFSADEERTSTWKEAMEERDAEVCDAKRRHQDAERKCRILEGEVEELKLHVLRGDDKCRSLEDKVQCLEVTVQELDNELDDLAWNGDIEVDRLAARVDSLLREKEDLENEVNDLKIRNAALERERKITSSFFSARNHRTRDEKGEGNTVKSRLGEGLFPHRPPLYPR